MKKIGSHACSGANFEGNLTELKQYVLKMYAQFDVIDELDWV